MSVGSEWTGEGFDLPVFSSHPGPR